MVLDPEAFRSLLSFFLENVIILNVSYTYNGDES